LNALVNVKLGSFSSVSAVNTQVDLATANIAVGSYKVYATDLSGNISIPGATIVVS